MDKTFTREKLYWNATPQKLNLPMQQQQAVQPLPLHHFTPKETGSVMPCRPFLLHGLHHYIHLKFSLSLKGSYPARKTCKIMRDVPHQTLNAGITVRLQYNGPCLWSDENGSKAQMEAAKWNARWRPMAHKRRYASSCAV